jgi:hypothetical protein
MSLYIYMLIFYYDIYFLYFKNWSMRNRIQLDMVLKNRTPKELIAERYEGENSPIFN